jgi:predicted DNA-binding transcriptional regulator YafY
VVPSRQELRDRLDRLHEAIDARRVVRLAYASLAGSSTRRDVEPLCLGFWGQAWTLGGWCRLREDFRNFRLDRIAELEPLAEVAADDPARGLRAFLSSAGADPEAEI